MQIDVFNDIGADFDNARRGMNFQNWLGDHGKSKCVMAYNTNDKDIKCFHQPGGTGIRVTGSMTQYCRKLPKIPGVWGGFAWLSFMQTSVRNSG